MYFYKQINIFVVLVFFAFASLPTFAQNELIAKNTSQQLPTVLAARISSTPERARLVIDLSAKTKFALVSIINQDKSLQIAIDVQAFDVGFSDEITFSQKGIISNVKIEKVQNGRIRTWLSLKTPALVQQAYVLEPFENQPARLVVDIVITNEMQFVENAKADMVFSTGQRINNNETGSKVNLGDHSNNPGDLNVIAKSKPLIIIDPGHGGRDNGASANNGIKEKDITLEFAKNLQTLLLNSQRFDVALTRDGDDSIRLAKRVLVARMNKADLFISIHADSFDQSEVSGLSVYTRDEEATDSLDKILAENENKSDIIAGFESEESQEMKDQVVSILLDLMRREMRKQSFMVATSIVKQLEPSVELRRFPIRKADFLVLQSPDIPAILIELGFLSNHNDASNLTSNEWRNRVSEAIARGIATYFDNVENE